MTAPMIDLSAPEPAEVVVCECGCPPTSSEGPGRTAVLHRTGCLVGVIDSLTELAKLQEADRAAGARSCRTCGCTERFACPGGCSWIELDRCSVCIAIGAGS